MGKVKTVIIDKKGNLVEVDTSSTKKIRFDIKTNTLEKLKPKQKGMTRRLGQGMKKSNG